MGLSEAGREVRGDKLGPIPHHFPHPTHPSAIQRKELVMLHHYQIEVPYDLTPDEVTMEPGSSGDLIHVLRALLDRAEDPMFTMDRRDHDTERICRAAVILYKKFPERSFSECLDTAMVMEFG
jgi:hypothetical protein